MRLMFDRSGGLAAVEVDVYLVTLWLLRLSGLQILSERMIAIECALVFSRCPYDPPKCACRSAGRFFGRETDPAG